MRSSRGALRHAAMRKFREQDATNTFSGGVTACAMSVVVEDDREIIVVRFAASGNTPSHSVRLIGLDPSHPIAPTLRDAYAAAACGQGAVLSRVTIWSRFRSGLLRFLLKRELEGFVIDDVLLARFANWLNSTDAGKAPLAVRPRKNCYRTALIVLRAGSEAGVPGLKGLQLDWRFNPWAGQQSAPPPQKAFLSPSDMTSILRCCRSEVETVMAELADDLGDLVDGRESNPVVTEAHRLRQGCGSAFGKEGGHALAELEGMACEGAVGLAAIRLLTPAILDLVPFLLLMAHYTAFNLSTLTAMRTTDVERRTMGKVGWTVVTGFKNRSDNVQRAPFAIDGSSTNPDRLLTFVERWTSALRSWSSSDKLWLARTRDGIRDLGDDTKSTNLPARVELWLKRRELPAASMSAIRKGMLDLGHLASGGDESEVRRMGGQRSPDIIERHYTSPAARLRDQHRLASGVQELERFVLSQGKVDARRLPDTIDRSAATPGFICADPYASPIPDEVPGRLCGAYGHCPICPLAAVDRKSARSCGYLHLLLDRIESGLEGNNATSPPNYIGVWLPIADYLRSRWLPVFDSDTRTAAKEVRLVTLPEIE